MESAIFPLVLGLCFFVIGAISLQIGYKEELRKQKQAEFLENNDPSVQKGIQNEDDEEEEVEIEESVPTSSQGYEEDEDDEDILYEEIEENDYPIEEADDVEDVYETDTLEGSILEGDNEKEDEIEPQMEIEFQEEDEEVMDTPIEMDDTLEETIENLLDEEDDDEWFALRLAELQKKRALGATNASTEETNEEATTLQAESNDTSEGEPEDEIMRRLKKYQESFEK